MSQTAVSRAKVVVLFEGTWNDNRNPSVITRLYNLLAKSKSLHVHRTMGSGTRGAKPFKRIFGLTGWDTCRIVLNQYWWLSSLARHYNWKLDDFEVYAFGFSRGGFQARVLCEILKLYGLARTKRQAKYHVILYQLMVARLVLRWLKLSSGVRIAYLGLWDAVRTHLSSFIICHEDVDPYINCRHAKAIHESRIFFRPVTCAGASERWFIGAHSDVGWGYKRTSTLGKIAAEWVLEPVWNLLGMNTNRDKLIDSFVNVQALLVNYWFLFHDSSKATINCKGLFPTFSRSIGEPHEIVRAILNVAQTTDIYPIEVRTKMLMTLSKCKKHTRILLSASERKKIYERVEKSREKIRVIFREHGLLKKSESQNEFDRLVDYASYFCKSKGYAEAQG